jgi:NTP pyrophosphatase (non-canonical NTP hydrolase)
MFQKSIEILESKLEDTIIKLSTSNRTGKEISLIESIDGVNDLKDSITFLKNGDAGGFGSLISLVRQWGRSKGIIGVDGKATLKSQFKKLIEEVDEINEAIEAKDQLELIDGIGDSTVVLILLADLAGIRFETCLQAAYDEIKGRTGKMVDGQFLKDIPKDDFDEDLQTAFAHNDAEVCESCQ